MIGPRQVGKTTLVKTLSEQLPKPILYLDLENLNDYILLEKDPQWFLEQHIDKIVVIDEVQRMLSLFPLLRSLIDPKNEGGKFVLLGSASPELLAKSSETLAGRIVYRELTSIRFDEAKQSNIALEQHSTSKGNTEAVQDLKSQHNFIVTPSSEAFAINSLWKVCNIENIWEHLQPLKVLKE